MKLLFLFLISIGVVELSAQLEICDDSIKATYIERSFLGQHLITKDSLFCDFLQFDKQIESFHYDTLNEIIIGNHKMMNAFLEPSRFVLLFSYSLKNRNYFWLRKINTNKTDFFITGRNLFIENNKIIMNTDLLTLESKWELPSRFFAFNTDLNVGVTFVKKFFGNAPNGLTGINFDNGSALWTNDKMKLNSGYNFSSFFKDSNIIFINNKLYGLNLKTGSHWESKYTFTQNCYTHPYAGTCKYCSNFYRDSFGFVIASNEYLHRFNYSGEEIWKSELPANDGQPGLSYLFKHNSSWYVVNRGFTIMGEMYKVFVPGKPFIARYSLEGALLSYQVFNSQDILNYKLDSSEIWIIQRRGVTKLDSSLRILFNKSMRKSEIRDWFDFVEGNFYLNDNDQFSEVSPKKDKEFYIYQDDHSIAVYDQEINITRQIEKENIFFRASKDSYHNKIVISYNAKKLAILSSENKLIFMMPNFKQLVIKNKKILVLANDRIFIIDESILNK